MQWVKNTLIKQADALWLPADNYKNDYNFVNQQRTTFVYGFNTVDNDRFKVGSPKKFGANKLICVARLVPVKNISRLLTAWKLVEQATPVGELTIIGNGGLYDELLALSINIGLQRVIFAGAIDNDNLADQYQQADALILASLSETWGLVVNEAMAAGLPVLLSNKINAASSLLKEGVNGYSFSPDDTHAIANTILKFFGLEEDQKVQMSAASLALVEDMDYEQMGDKLLKGLQIIAKGKPLQPGLIARGLIKAWPGKYDTSVWDKI